MAMTNDQRDQMIQETHEAVLLIAPKVNDHHADLYGNGKPGMKLDVDRLKGFRKISCTLFVILGTAVLGGIIRFIFSHIGH